MSDQNQKVYFPPKENQKLTGQSDTSPQDLSQVVEFSKKTLPKLKNIDNFEVSENNNKRDSLNLRKSANLEDSLSGISFASHISPSELGLSQSIKAEIPKEDQQEIIANTFNNHKLLENTFKSWINYTHQSREMNVRQLLLQRKQNMILLNKYFTIIKDRTDLLEKLHEIGQIIRASKHFMIWKRYSEGEVLRREKFLQFLLQRRRIYERSFFEQWKVQYNFNIKAEANSEKQKQNLLSMAFQCFKLNVKLNKQERSRIQQLYQNHNIFVEKKQFDQWKYAMKLRRLQKVAQRKLRFLRLEIYFDIWIGKKQKRDKQRNKVAFIFDFAKKCRMKQFLYKWIDRYNKNLEIELRAKKVLKKRRVKVFDNFFYKWINQFNTVNYLHKIEQQIAFISDKIKERKCFGIWMSKYSSITNRRNICASAEQEFFLWKENRLFYIWKSQFYFSRYSRIKTNRLSRKLRKSKLQRYFSKWNENFHKHMNEKLNHEQSNKYRDLSLKLKAFSRMRAYALEMRQMKQKLHKAILFRKLKLQQKALKSWKHNHRIIFRRCFMVTSVLKLWAKNSQSKRFNAWREWAQQRKNKRREEKAAFRTFHSRTFQFAVTCFIVGSKLKPRNEYSAKQKIQEILQSDTESDPLKSDDDYDLLKSEESLENDQIPVKYSIDHTPLKLPQRPAFLFKNNNKE